MKRDLKRHPVSPYDALAPEIVEEHPIDRMIERHSPQKGLRRRMRRATDRLASLLGDRRQAWLTVEKLWNDYRFDRERAYFDVGYEQGRKLGRAEALHGGPSGKETRSLVGRICHLVDESDLAPSARVAALLKLAWSFAVAATEKGNPPHHQPASEPDPE